MEKLRKKLTLLKMKNKIWMIFLKKEDLVDLQNLLKLYSKI